MRDHESWQSERKSNCKLAARRAWVMRQTRLLQACGPNPNGEATKMGRLLWYLSICQIQVLLVSILSPRTPFCSGHVFCGSTLGMILRGTGMFFVLCLWRKIRPPPRGSALFHEWRRPGKNNCSHIKHPSQPIFHWSQGCVVVCFLPGQLLYFHVCATFDCAMHFGTIYIYIYIGRKRISVGCLASRMYLYACTFLSTN